MTEQQIADLGQMAERTADPCYVTIKSDSVYVAVDSFINFLAQLAEQVETTHGHDLTMSLILKNAHIIYDYDGGIDAVNFGD